MRVDRYNWGDRRDSVSKFEPQEISNSNCFFCFFSNRPTDPEFLSGMPVKQLFQLKWPNADNCIAVPPLTEPGCIRVDTRL